ncbi:MAG: copper homeostasis protein CutC [Bacteroidetes bacterium]|nr:copper homeostasis protein CutC [Bacteroidota bacterium]
MILEVCVDSVESSVNAEAGGADRLELCGALGIGGITPGAGTIDSVTANVSIPVYVMIRPRGGDFLYSDYEFEVMRRDIDFAREAGATGVVFGILLPDGRVDTERTAWLTGYASPLPVTFHRAFDLAADPFRALEDIIAAGPARILTSGQQNSALSGAGLIADLIEKARGRITVMPGAGINQTNFMELVRITGATEYHLTGRKVAESSMQFRRRGIALGHPALADDDYLLRYADSETIAAIKRTMK